MLPSSMHTPWAVSDRNNFSELNTVQGSTVSRYLSTSLPFCPKESLSCFNVPVTRHAATLDTEPRAKSYSGRSRTHLFSNHFQYARAMVCYPQVVVSGLRSSNCLSAAFTASELGNRFARSGAIKTIFVPCRYLSKYFPRTGLADGPKL
jgi:hypothetical protein